jgi:diguanylate cyclase (GGDEF)-like protein
MLGNLVFVDSGTKVYNRAYFNLQLENEIARARREEKSLALVIFDIDDFRAVNKTYGYEGGNDVLARVARLLKSGLRPFDSVARWGGEEFAMILTAPIAVDDAKNITARLRRAVEKHLFSVTGLEGKAHSIGLTVSGGGAIYPGDAATGTELWRAANSALMWSKEHGKNQVTFVSELAEGGPPREEKK